MIAVALKWVDHRPEVDPLSGDVRTDPRTSGASEADLAALEWGLRLSEAWGDEVVAVTAGPRVAEAVLRDAVAVGAARGVRVDLAAGSPSEDVAAALAPALVAADIVLCGDWSLDRGSGSVPAFLAARLGAAQALGLTSLAPGRPGDVHVERRLDGGRRERLLATSPAVLSVEGGTARLRRAPLDGVLRARTAAIEVVPGPATTHGGHPVRTAPYRPRPRALAAPSADLDARQRILALTGALVERDPPKRLVLDPVAAADALLDQLRAWGYLAPAAPWAVRQSV